MQNYNTHWNVNVIILMMKFSLLAALEAVIYSRASRDENLVKMAFLFQGIATIHKQ